MDFGTILSVAGPLLGGLMQSDSVDQASQAQAQGTSQAAAAQLQAQREAIAEQRRQYDQTRSDFAPYRNVGGSAITTLGQLMGLGGGGASSGAPLRSYDDIYREVLARAPMVQSGPGQEYGIIGEHEGGFIYDWIPTKGESTADTQWARAEADRLFAEQQQMPSMQSDPQSVMDAPLNRKFTVSDFYNDPVTQLSMQFGLDQGRKAIDLGAGAAGLRNSGATLKALTKFGTDYAGQQAGASRGRFVNDQDNLFNRLSGVAGTGQSATNATANAGLNTASGIAGTLSNTGTNLSNLYSAQGNARGAAAIAGGNTWGNAFNTIGDWWSQQNQVNKYRTPSFNPGSMSFFGGFT